jgi:hypothetical protein
VIWILKNGEQVESHPQGALVSGQGQLSSLKNLEPGSIAYTAGYASMWQLGTDGTWHTIVTEGGT